MGMSSEYHKLTLTLNFILPSIVFHNKNCVSIMVFNALAFLQLISGLILHGEEMSVRPCEAARVSNGI